MSIKKQSKRVDLTTDIGQIVFFNMYTIQILCLGTRDVNTSVENSANREVDTQSLQTMLSHTPHSMPQHVNGPPGGSLYTNKRKLEARRPSPHLSERRFPNETPTTGRRSTVGVPCFSSKHFSLTDSILVN